MTFLTILGVSEILCSFRLVIKGETGKKIPESSRLEFLEKYSVKILFYQMQKTTPLGCWIEEFSRFTFFENTISNSSKVLRAKFLEKDGLFYLLAYASFTASRTFLQQLLACLNFRITRFILLLQTKKVTSMNYGSNTSSWKLWRCERLDLISPMRDTYINSNLNPLIKSTSSCRITELKDILPWNIPQMIT